LAVGLARRLAQRAGPRLSAAIAAAAFIAIVAAGYTVMPDIGEIPEQFSSDALWKFRAAALGTQLLLWATLGVVFGALSARVLERA
jgi:hypothetical protein